MRRLFCVSLMMCSCIQVGCAYMDPLGTMERMMNTEGGQKMFDTLKIHAKGKYTNPAIGFRLFQGGEAYFNGADVSGEVTTEGEVTEDERGFAPGRVEPETVNPAIWWPKRNEAILSILRL